MNINRVQKFQQQKSPPKGFAYEPHSINTQAKKRVFRATQVSQPSLNQRNSRIFKNIPPQEKQHIYQRRPYQSKVQLGSSRNKQYLFQKHQQSISPKHIINLQGNKLNFPQTTQQNPYNLPMTNINSKLFNQNTKSKKHGFNGKIPFKNINQLPKQKQILNSERIIISNISDRLIPKQDILGYNGIMQKNGNQDSTVTIPRNYKKFLSQPSMPQSPKTTIPNSAHFINPFQVIQQSNHNQNHIQFSPQNRSSDLFFNSQTKKIKHKKLGLSKEESQFKQLSSMNRPTSRSKLLGQGSNKRFIKLSKSLPMKITQMYQSSDFRIKAEEEERNKHINKLHTMQNRQNQYQNQYYQGIQPYKQQRRNNMTNKKTIENISSQNFSTNNIGTTNILHGRESQQSSTNEIRLMPKIIKNQHARGSRIFQQTPSTIIQNHVISHSPQQLKNVIKFNQYSPSKIQQSKNNSQLQQQIHSKVPSVIIRNQPTINSSNLRPQSAQIRPSSSIMSPRVMNPMMQPSQMMTSINQQNRLISPQHSSFHVSSARFSPGQTIIPPNQAILQQSQINNNIKRPHSSYESVTLSSRQFSPRNMNTNLNINRSIQPNNTKDIVLLRDSQNKNPSIILHQSNRNQQNYDQSQNGLQSEQRSINQSQQGENNDGYQEIQYKIYQRQKYQQDPLPLQSKPTSPQLEFSTNNQNYNQSNTHNLLQNHNNFTHTINNGYNFQSRSISQFPSQSIQSFKNFNSFNSNPQHSFSNSQFMNQHIQNNPINKSRQVNQHNTRLINYPQQQKIIYNQVYRPTNNPHPNIINQHNPDQIIRTQPYQNISSQPIQNIRPFIRPSTQSFQHQHINQQNVYQINSNNNSGWLSINRDKYSISEYCVIKKDNNPASNMNNVLPINVIPQNVITNLNTIQQNHGFNPLVQGSNSFHVHNTNNSFQNNQNSNDKRKESPINIIHSSPTPPQSPFYVRNHNNNPIIEENSIQSQESQNEGKYQYGNSHKNSTSIRQKQKQQYGMPTESYHSKYRQYYNANDYYQNNQINNTYNKVLNGHINTNNTTPSYQGNYYTNQSSQVVPLDYSKSFIRSNNLNESSQNSIKDHFNNRKYQQQSNKVLQDQSQLKQSIFENRLLPSSNSLNEKDEGYYQGESKVLQRMNYNNYHESNSKRNESQYHNVVPALYSYKKIGSSSSGAKYQQQKYSYCE